jgi:hypothetical protein
MDDGANLGQAAASKIACYGVTPVTQCAVVAQLTASTESTTSCATAINSILTCLKNFGVMASA